MARRTDALIPLQEIDHDIHRVRSVRDEKPRNLAHLEERLQRAKDNLQAMKDEIKALKLEIQKRDTSIKEFDDRINKLTGQSMQAKKNDEYQAFLKEISGVKADKSRVEDGQLDLMFQADEKGKLERLREAELKTVEGEYGTAKKKIEAEMAELDKQIDALEARRREAVAGVDKEILDLYQRVLKAKDDGLALVPVVVFESVEQEGVRPYPGCGGCSVEITKQMLNELKRGKEIIFCRSCSRILYDTGAEPAPKKPA